MRERGVNVAGCSDRRAKQELICAATVGACKVLHYFAVESNCRIISLWEAEMKLTCKPHEMSAGKRLVF